MSSARRLALLMLAACALAGVRTARADDTPGSIVFTRDGALWRIDGKGKGPEAQLAPLPAGSKQVRSLTSDERGSVLLADVDGAWFFMLLDGTDHELHALPCAAGPAHLTADGTCVYCAAQAAANAKPDATPQTLLFQFATGKHATRPVPPATTYLVGEGTNRRLIWADDKGVWSMSTTDSKDKKQVADAAPVRGFSVSPDGARALGVYVLPVLAGKHDKGATQEVLTSYALDGVAAKRKVIRFGMPIGWAWNGVWALVQDRDKACIMRATGGENKCWPGFTAVSISQDGRWALVLGLRDAPPMPAPRNKSSIKAVHDKPSPPRPVPVAGPDDSGLDEGGEGEGEEGEDAVVDPTTVGALPTGDLSLFRARLDGSAFTDPPILVERVVDGAAAWIPAPAP